MMEVVVTTGANQNTKPR